MFGILKKKISKFGDKLKKNVKEKEEQVSVTEEVEESPSISTEPIIEPKTEKVEEPLIEKPKTEDDLVLAEIRKEIEEEDKAKKPKETSKIIEKQIKEREEPIIEEEKPITKEIVEKIPKKDSALPFIEEEINEEVDVESEMLEESSRVKSRDINIKKASEDKRELKASIGKKGKLKGLIKRAIEISEDDLETLLWELELSLLESDVEQDTARDLVKGIRTELIGKKVSVKTIDAELNNTIKEILTEMMTTTKRNLVEEIKNSDGPYKILMIGPNGAGKTTHIAKLTHYFKKEGFSVVLAAADTFRSGAIDQLQVHADKLEVKLIKQQYGADPAAVAFDAVKSAKANNTDVVIIDTAGRQETNKNLMEELKKIKRVVEPDIKIYVGEAYVGQGLLDQAIQFDTDLGIDGFILSKIDTDAKGGTSISLLYKLKKPILYVGTGQGYEDFEEFSPEFILNRII
jgi:fused signal recognition particle receptor